MTKHGLTLIERRVLEDVLVLHSHDLPMTGNVVEPIRRALYARVSGNAELRLADAYAALRAIAEGNLGSGPGQANYETIKQVASNALPEDQRAGFSKGNDDGQG